MVVTEHLLASDFTRTVETKSRIDPTKVIVDHIYLCPSCKKDLDHQHGVTIFCDCSCEVLRHGNGMEVTVDLAKREKDNKSSG